MARIQIDFPDHFIFSTEIEVRITDLNYGGHLGNDSLLSIMHEARMRFFKSIDCSELDLKGVGTIMGDVAIQYKLEAYFGDILTIEIAVAEFTRVSFDIFYRIHCKGKTVAIAKTGIVCYDYTVSKVLPVPAAFSQLIGAAEKK